MNYTWTPPRCSPGDVLTYNDHRGKPRAATCISVSTHYQASGEASHAYYVQPDKGMCPITIRDNALIDVPAGQSTERDARG